MMIVKRGVKRGVKSRIVCFLGLNREFYETSG
jgi:hypothetical protein